MKNKIMGVIIVFIILLTCGCGSSNYIKDKDKNLIQYKETGQSLPNNILCKPKEGTKLYKLYEKNDKQLATSMKKLPTCNNFKINSNKSNSIWEMLFVKPLAYLILKLGNLLNIKGGMGISVILIGLAIRILLLPFAFKTQKQNRNMQKAQGDMQKIELKYRGRDDKESMMLKSQEMMAVYKKHNVKPMSGCLISFLQLPIFFAFLQALNRIPAVFEDKLLWFNLGKTPYVGISNGEYQYLILIILIALSTYFSFKYSMKSTANTATQTPDMKKQMNMMTNIMVIMIILTSFSLSTAIGLYWITTYAFIAIQTFIFKSLLKENKKDKDKKIKKESKNKIQEKLKIKENLKYGK